MNGMKAKLVFRGLLAAVSVVIVVSGCPNPITDQTFLQMTDKNPPTVDVASPTGGTPYTQTVTVQGSAIDGEGRLKGIAWIVTGALGLLEEGTIPASGIDTDGAFSFQFSTLAWSGPLAVTVEATDWNDNVGEASITLTEPNGQLSSFSAAAANKKVTLDWDPVAGATYTVYYTTNGTLPSESYGTQVTIPAPPYDVTSLANGSMHVFLLKASTAGHDYWSGYVRAIPLSPFTLAPQVQGEYHRIALEWRAIPATDEYEVFRAPDPTGPWSNLTGVIRATGYVDTAVQDDTWYYYEVRPSLAGSVMSTFNGAEPLQVPPTPGSAVSGISLPSPADKVKKFGNYAFVADEATGLVVLDVRDPRNPIVAATLDTTDAMDIALNAAGTMAYIADGYGGLRIVDITIPTNPVLLGTQAIGSPDDTFAVSVIEPPGLVLAYVLARDASSRTWLRGIDVTTPSSPFQPGYAAYNPGATYDFTDLAATWYTTLSRRYLYLASGSSSNGELVKLWDTGAVFSFRGAYNDASPPSGAYKSNHVYVKTPSTSSDYVYSIGSVKAYLEPPPPYALRVFNQTVDIPGVVGTSAASKGYIQDIIVRGTKAYIADGIGLQAVDVSVPTSPALGAYWNTPGTSYGIDVDASGTTAYVASFTLGMHTVDLTLPLTLATRSKYTGAGGTYTYDVAIRGDLAVAAISHVGQQRLQLIDITNPVTPTSLGALVMNWPKAVALSGWYAFAVDNDGLKVVDIGNTGSPSLLATAAAVATMGRITIRGDYAYVTGGGLQIYDISDPLHPFAVGFYDSDGGGIQDVALRGGYAYVTDGAYFQPNSLKVLDVTDPANPTLVGKGATGAVIVNSVSLAGDYAFMTDGLPDQGVWAVNVNPLSAQFMTAYGPCDTAMGATMGASGGIAAYGSWAFVADANAGLAVVDISNPNALSDAKLRLNHATQISSAREVVLSGRYAYVVDENGSTGGLVIVEISP
jgi:hypothetical protein